MNLEEQALLDIRREREAAAAATGNKPDLTKQSAHWHLRVVEPSTGKVYEGDFVSRVPTIRERDEIGLIVGRLSGGVPYDSIPPVTRMRLERAATFALVLTKRPKWFEEPGEFLDDTVPSAVYAKVIEHYTEFFRPRVHEGGGAEAPGDASGSAPSVEG